MLCPKCAKKTIVVGTVSGVVNQRFRQCKACGHTFQTIEAVRFDDYWRWYAKYTLEDNQRIMLGKESASDN
ncbi:MAG: hypothetical protein ACTTJS_04080 [Wolinella sp.]